MAKMKDLLIGTIENLENETGYDFEYLMNKYLDTVMDPDSSIAMDDFIKITRERDW